MTPLQSSFSCKILAEHHKRNINRPRLQQNPTRDVESTFFHQNTAILPLRLNIHSGLSTSMTQDMSLDIREFQKNLSYTFSDLWRMSLSKTLCSNVMCTGPAGCAQCLEFLTQTLVKEFTYTGAKQNFGSMNACALRHKVLFKFSVWIGAVKKQRQKRFRNINKTFKNRLILQYAFFNSFSD